MKKKILCVAATASIMFSAFTTGPAKAADGSINITGTILPLTCTITGGGGASGTKDLSLTLPTLSKKDVNAGAGGYSGSTPFQVKLAGTAGSCTPASGKGLTLAFAKDPSYVSNSSGNLLNIAAAGKANNVEVAIRALANGGSGVNDASPVLNFWNQTNFPVGTQNTADYTFHFIAQYYTSGSAGDGAVSAKIEFNVDHK